MAVVSVAQPLQQRVLLVGHKAWVANLCSFLNPIKSKQAVRWEQALEQVFATKQEHHKL